MWTLILVTFIASGASTGGVATATSFLDFPDEAKCRTAAQAMSTRADHVNVDQVGPHPNISPTAIYRIIAQCVAR
jgi:rubredoxin